MSATSLALLKGVNETGKGKAKDAEVSQAASEEEVVDVDSLSSAEIDALLKENQIDTPTNWKKMSVEQKRGWMKEQFEEAPASVEDEVAAAVEEAPTKPKAKSKPKLEVVTEEPGAKVAVEEDAAAKPEKAKKTKGKALAKSDVKSGEIVEGDVLQDVVFSVENMKKEEALAAIKAINDETEFTFFKLGGILSMIQAHAWYDPHASFREFVENEHGIQYRKAIYMVEIYNRLTQSGVPWSKVAPLGWTKIKEIARVMTAETADEWVKIASQQTTLQLTETIKNKLSKDASKSLEDQSSKTVTTKTFKVHNDQKETVEAALAKAKDQSGTTVDTVALEFICIEFLGTITPKERLQKMGIEAALKVLEDAFPNVNITVDVDGEAEAA